MLAYQVDPSRSAGNQRWFPLKLLLIGLCCTLLNLPHEYSPRQRYLGEQKEAIRIFHASPGLQFFTLLLSQYSTMQAFSCMLFALFAYAVCLSTWLSCCIRGDSLCGDCIVSTMAR
jgi:hypothetical protein